MRYIKARHKADVKKDIWERHVAMTLWGIKQTFGKDSRYKTYDELLIMTEPKKQIDNRSAKQIYDDTMSMFKRE